MISTDLGGAQGALMTRGGARDGTAAGGGRDMSGGVPIVGIDELGGAMVGVAGGGMLDGGGDVAEVDELEVVGVTLGAGRPGGRGGCDIYLVGSRDGE